MKRFLVLILIFLLCNFLQAQSTLPGANVITVKNISFIEICMALLDQGYSIDRKDEQLQTIRTESKKYPRYWNAAYRLNIRIKDSTALITGTFVWPFEIPTQNSIIGREPLFNNDPIYNQTSKKGTSKEKSLIGYAFQLMNEFAISLKKETGYLKQ